MSQTDQISKIAPYVRTYFRVTIDITTKDETKSNAENLKKSYLIVHLYKYVYCLYI